MSGHKKSLLILGAKSDIGIASAIEFARNGFNLQLVGRDIHVLEEKYKKIASEHGVSASFHELDILETEKFDQFLRSLVYLPEVILCVIGTYSTNINNYKNFQNVIRTNFESPAILLGLFAMKFQERRSGSIIGVSSWAGDRVRGSNVLYGSSKAGFTGFLSGIRNKFFASNIHVMTVNPGYVKTKMTAGMDSNNFLTTTPDYTAKKIYKGYINKSNIIYVKPIWRFISLFLRLLPESFFKTKNL